jgi:hypothetical protein
MRTNIVSGLALLVVVAACGDGSGGADHYSKESHSCILIMQKTQSCGFMTQGDLPCDTSRPDSAGDQCQATCIQQASCEDLRSFHCKDVGAQSILQCTHDCAKDIPLFTCGDGGTIPMEGRCDMDQECSDNSDEQGCPEDAGFWCADGSKQIQEHKVCDFDEDCVDNSDEEGCPEFGCGISQTIPTEWRCNIEEDCENGADEAGCATWTLPCMVDETEGEEKW